MKSVWHDDALVPHTGAASPVLEKPENLRRLGLIIFISVLLLAVPQAALLPLLDRDEPRFAEASREMVQSGNYVVPTFNHAPRYAKPPLTYWCQSASFVLLGESALAARLPSLVATAGTALLLFIWGVQLGNRNIGVIASLSYAFCLQTMQQGRVATADALLIFFMTLTALAGWNLVQLAQTGVVPLKDPRWNKWGIALTLGFAGGFLAKGPEAWLPMYALIIGAAFLGKRIAQAYVAIFLLGLLIVACWAVPAFAQTHGDYWKQGLNEGIGQRAISGMQGHGASSIGWYILLLPLYLVLFWVSALPWSPLLVWEWKKIFRGVKPDGTDGYLYINTAAIFIVFTLMVTKLPHYTLPAFPFIALWFARRWVNAGLKPALPIKLTAGFGVGFALCAMVYIPMAMAHEASPSPVAELVEKARAEAALTTSTEFALVDFQEPNTVWEMRRVVGGYGHVIPENDVLAFLDLPGPRAVILSTALWKKLEPTYGKAAASWKTFQARGFNAAKGSFVDLTMVVKS